VVERVEGTLDARDRLTEEKVYDAATGGTLTNTISYGYDTNGSLTSRIATAGGSLTEVWDVRGRLQSATDVQGSTNKQALYRYDPDGIRLREEVTTTTGGVTTKEIKLLVVDHQSPAGYAEVIEERTESGLIVATYVYGAGLDPISVARSGQPVGLYLVDGHSGVRQVIDLLTAAVLAGSRYDAFGNKVASAGTFSDPIGYRGERLDPVLAQHYFRGRPYQAPTGRFTAMDPQADTYANPLEVNRHTYAGADGIDNLDPSGQSFIASVGNFFVRASLFSFYLGTALTVFGVAAHVLGFREEAALIFDVAALSFAAAFAFATAFELWIAAAPATAFAADRVQRIGSRFQRMRPLDVQVRASQNPQSANYFAQFRGRTYANSTEVGDAGEAIVTQVLKDEGYRDIVAVKNRMNNGIDIVARAQNGRFVVFEVKTSNTGNLDKAQLSSRQQSMEAFLEEVLTQAASASGRYQNVDPATQDRARELLRAFLDDRKSVTGSVFGVDLQAEKIYVSPWPR